MTITDGPIAAIETHYAGCRFRSRLEARWAVFFDSLGIPWQYEPQGFDLGGRAYLPDFLIQAPGPVWVEVKGDAERLDVDLLATLVAQSREAQFLVILGPVPLVKPLALPTHPLIYRAFDVRGHVFGRREEIARACWAAIDRSGMPDADRRAIYQMIEREGAPMVAMTNAFFAFGSGPLLSAAGMPSYPVWPLRGDGDALAGMTLPIVGSHPRTSAAYEAARSARFEHGEHG